MRDARMCAIKSTGRQTQCYMRNESAKWIDHFFEKLTWKEQSLRVIRCSAEPGARYELSGVRT
jgi:hypothetical protein